MCLGKLFPESKAQSSPAALLRRLAHHPSVGAALLYITNHFRHSRAQSHHNRHPVMIKQVKKWAAFSWISPLVNHQPTTASTFDLWHCLYLDLDLVILLQQHI